MRNTQIDELVARCTTTSVCDVLMQLGLRKFMDQRLRALVPGTAIWGPARTIVREPAKPGVGSAGGNALVEGVETAETGMVLVFNGNSEHEAALWGGLMAVAGNIRGIAGVVADGPVRDRNEIIALEQGCFCTGTVPAGQAGILRTVALDETIQCGGITVEPGDFMFGDDDGIVVIPSGREFEVLEKAAEVEAADQEAAKLLLGGTDLMSVMKKTGRA